MAITTESRFACLWCGQGCASSGAVYRHIAEHHPNRLPQPSAVRAGTKQRILEFIKRYRIQHGYPPTVREIGAAVGVSSPATVHRHLVDLVEIGALERVPRRARARRTAVF
jgi:hypothetical protein